jgi:hypothetical protein
MLITWNVRKSEGPSLITIRSEINLTVFKETDLMTTKQFLKWTTQAGVHILMPSMSMYKDILSLCHGLFNADYNERIQEFKNFGLCGYLMTVVSFANHHASSYSGQRWFYSTNKYRRNHASTYWRVVEGWVYSTYNNYQRNKVLPFY